MTSGGKSRNKLQLLQKEEDGTILCLICMLSVLLLCYWRDKFSAPSYHCYRHGHESVRKVKLWCVQGRILVFSVRDGKLHVIAEKEVKGAVYNVNPFQARTSTLACELMSAAGLCMQSLLLVIDITASVAQLCLLM